MANELPLISFIVTTFNSEKTIIKVLQAIEKQNYPKNRFEIIIVDDNSGDNTKEKVSRFQKKYRNITFFKKPLKGKKGPAVSTNLGIKIAKGDFIASVDADAIIKSDWLVTLLTKFKNQRAMIISGMIYTANPENIWAAFVGRELEDRLLKLKKEDIDSISPCNTIYRKEIFKKVGLFNENFKYYGQDVEFCYRVKKAGFRILLTKETGCYHFWKENLIDVLYQIYGTGYGRMLTLAKFPQKKSGDAVSGWQLIFQVPLTSIFITIALLSFLLQVKWMINFFIIISFTLFLIQVPVTIRIIKRTKDFRFLGLPFFLIIRNMVWVWAFLRYNGKQLRRLF